MIGILTLEKHSTGVWITNLVHEIQLLAKHSDFPLGIEIVELESLEINLFEKPTWSILVNRVSDAANPYQAKTCLSVLRTCKIWNIPCFNGPDCYSIGMNKYLHHIVFTRSGLSSPKSILLRDINRDNLMQSALKLKEDLRCNMPFLIKPNSAGFGQGIEMISTLDDLKEFCENKSTSSTGNNLDLSTSNDNVILIQEYIKPLNNEVYRVWFLDGKVQCGLKRVVDANGDITFTNQCVASTCSMPMDKNKNTRSHENYSWCVPLEVRLEVENLLSHAGEDCHAGSVEFLRDGQGKRIYFDLNMLSTLPSLNSVNNIDGTWSEDFNPWKDLAQSVINKILPIDSM